MVRSKCSVIIKTEQKLSTVFFSSRTFFSNLLIELQEKWEVYGNHTQALEERAACAGSTEAKSSSATTRKDRSSRGQLGRADSLQRPGSED